MTNFLILGGELTMKVCPNCQNPNVADDAVACPSCGATFVVPQGNTQVPQQAPVQKTADQFDHTAEFDAKDIADNKLYAMLIYALGLAGIIVALLKKDDSAYLAFHLKQGLKLLVVSSVLTVVTTVLCWTFIVPIVASIALVGVLVLQVMLFIDVCNNKAKEPYLIRNIKFLD